MKVKINFYSFIFSLLGIPALFIIATSSPIILNFTLNTLQIHPLCIVLAFCIVTLILGFIGLSAATNWKLLLRGFLSIIITILEIVIIITILFLGNLFQFT
jgi:hypothetical protein